MCFLLFKADEGVRISLLGGQVFANVFEAVHDDNAIPSVSEARLQNPDTACARNPIDILAQPIQIVRFLLHELEQSVHDT